MTSRRTFGCNGDAVTVSNTSVSRGNENTYDRDHHNITDGPIDDKLCSFAQSLISQLQSDFEAEGKTTCRDCLRSKSLPCSKVTEIAEGDIFSGKNSIENSSQDLLFSSSDILTKSYQILLDEYTKFCPPYKTSRRKAPSMGMIHVASDDAVTHHSSLQCMSRISAILRFIQLLLLLFKTQREENKSSFLSDAQINQMIVSLLQKWTLGICQLHKFCMNSGRNMVSSKDKDENDGSSENDCMRADATKSLRFGPIFCFAFYSLLRMNEYVQTRGPLLVPLWKGVCELANTLVTSPSASASTRDDNLEGTHKADDHEEIEDWREQLPPNILGDAIRVFATFLQEGKEHLECEAVQLGFTETDNTKITFQGKLVGFMIVRITHVLRIYFSLHETVSFRSEECSSSLSVSNEQGMNLVLNLVWRSLLGLRGMVTAIQLLYSVGQDGTSRGNEIAKVYHEIASKAGNRITDTIVNKENDKRISIPGLESLLLSNMVTHGSDLVGGGGEYRCYQDYQEDVRSNAIRLSVMSRTIGNVLALQQILEATASNSTYCLTPENAEPLLATIEHLHSTSVPQCLSACVIAVGFANVCRRGNANLRTIDTIVLGSLVAMTRTLQELELSSEFMTSPKRDSFCRLLVHWLAGNPNKSDPYNKENIRPVTDPESHHREHPLSRELVLSLIHAHIVGCERENGGCDEKGFNRKKFLSYLTKLVMDARTNTTLRRNIGALLIRLQTAPTSCDSYGARDVANELIEKQFIMWLKHNIICQRLSKRRKRPRYGENVPVSLDQQDLIVIDRVLSAGRGMSETFFLSTATEEHRSILRQEFKRLSSDCTYESSRKRGNSLLASANRNSLLLAWLGKSVTAGSTTSFGRLSEAMGIDLAVDVLRPMLSALAELKFKVGKNGDDIKLLTQQVTLYSSAMKLSTTWANVFGDQGNLPIEKVCQIIKNCISKDPWQELNTEDPNLSFVQDQHSILQFEALNLLGSIGKAIPANCSERVLRTVRRAFVSFLSSKEWTVKSLGISSVMLFGSDLCAAHQQILPHCLPHVSMGLFQARASGEIWKGIDSDGNPNRVETIFEIADRMAHQLNRYMTTSSTVSTNASMQSKLVDILRSTTTSSIVPGSYVLEMPTQEDRRATVIFPPGPKSLEDINYMLGGMGDDSHMTTHLLKRAVVTPNGVFKLLLAPSR